MNRKQVAKTLFQLQQRSDISDALKKKLAITLAGGLVPSDAFDDLDAETQADDDELIGEMQSVFSDAIAGLDSISQSEWDNAD